MGTHRRRRHHVHRQAIVTGVAAGGLIAGCTSIPKSTSVPDNRDALSVAPPAVGRPSTAEVPDHLELVRDTGHPVSHHQVRRAATAPPVQQTKPRPQQGQHAHPRAVDSKRKAAGRTAAHARTAAAPAAKAQSRNRKPPVSRTQPRTGTLPVHTAFRISNTFRQHDARTSGRTGIGVDYAVPIGTRVYATHGGTIRAAGRSGSGYGTWVTVDYGHGFLAVYAHLSRVVVKRGDVVRAGALLGRSGSTGHSTGPHLHYELRRQGSSVDPRTVDLNRLGPTKATTHAPAATKPKTPAVTRKAAAPTRATSGSIQTIARRLIDNSGQFSCFSKVIERESGWNPRATNPSSGAYGLPQALPGRKMATAGADWRTNPATQIRWAMSYMDSRYGSPCAAWRFWQNHHWY